MQVEVKASNGNTVVKDNSFVFVPRFGYFGKNIVSSCDQVAVWRSQGITGGVRLSPITEECSWRIQIYHLCVQGQFEWAEGIRYWLLLKMS